MASRGKKRKAEAALAAAAEKREKPASSQKEVEEASVHELTRLRAQRRGPEPGAAPGGPGASSEGEPYQAPEGQLRGAELWTGIKKGPPRKLKFPEPQEVVKELKKYLSYAYSCPLVFFVTASVPGDVGAFMTGHGQTSVMCLKLWFLLQKRRFSCEAIL
ncbi:hypothetical protein DBR06_SOUSAS2310190 [Sousa chinensis]|nr:hypothetical protein DBR06_SOUSAS2310190 [Sousa chinensis]